MRNLGRSLTIASFTALYAYLLMLGGTYNLLDPFVRWLSLLAAGGVGLLWLAARWRGGWPWPRTALDGPMLLWLGAVGLSLVLNPETWRRQLIGVWFVLLYVGVWYLLSDLSARGIFRRAQLMEVVPFGGLAVVVVGFIQSRQWFTEQLPLMLAHSVPIAFPRPGSTLGNPNTLAAVLVVLIPFTLALGLRARGLVRWLAWLLAAASTLLMGLTFSRGGWVGLLAALALFVGLLLLDRGLIRPDTFRPWWDKQSRSVRAGLIAALFAGVLLVVAVVIVGLVSLGQSGRTLDLRTYIYSAAVNLFAEHPVAGQGLFTFGRGLATQASEPPLSPHSHAHNMALQVAAELGVVGLIALLATLLAVLRAVKANWQSASPSERVLLAGAIAGVAGFVVHHQLDFPAMVPVVALTGILTLVAACAPVGRGDAPGVARQRLSFGLVAALWVGVIVSGGWAAALYLDYTSALWTGMGERYDNDYRAGAEAMQAVIDRDPGLAVYYYQQGLLYGFAADEGDTAALVSAIDAFRHYVALEPNYAIGWVNLSALYTQAGDHLNAVEAARSAVAAAPDFWFYRYALGRAEERAGHNDRARAVYDSLLESFPDLVLFPDWNTPLRDELAATVTLSPLARTALLLEAGQAEQARTAFDSESYAGTDVSARVVEASLLLAEGRLDEGGAVLEAARELATTPEAEAWLQFGLAQRAQAQGEPFVRLALDGAEVALHLEIYEEDARELPNIHRIQYLHSALSRTYVPQVGYPVAGPLLRHLLAQAE